MNISDPVVSKGGLGGIPLFNLGFRPFFLGAGIFAVLSIALWSAIYLFQFSLPIESISIFQWHAHEMIYGYAMAVIAGFLLTATKNWTGIQTIHGLPLLVVFGLWAAARLLFFFGTSFLLLAGIMDILFSILLVIAVGVPIFKVKQWTQAAILSKLVLLALFNLLFYLGALKILDNGVYLGIYGGIYLIIGLVLTMARRVIPFFIERGVGYPVKLFNAKWLDIAILTLFLLFFIVEVFFEYQLISSVLALGLFLLNAGRLIGWHTPGIWKKSLLWSIYLALWFICLGFLMISGVHFMGLSGYLAIHAFAFGGIGLITLGMMSRVALGHAGMDVSNPPKIIGYALGFVIAGAIFRVMVPLFDSSSYLLWIGISQAFWVTGFGIFCYVYLPVLTRPRVDGQFG